MFVRTTENSLVELEGIVKYDKVASFDGNHRVTLYSKIGCSVLGSYSDKESAYNVIIALSVAIERNKSLFIMPPEPVFTDSDLYTKLKSM